MWRVKLALIGALVVIIGAGLLWRHCGRREEAPRPPANAPAFPAARFTRVPTEEGRVAVWDTLKPGRKKTRAVEVLVGMPAGTEAYEVTPAGDTPAIIYRSPEGEVYIPRGTAGKVRAYRKPAPFAAWELRPAAFAYTDLRRIGGGVALGVARFGRVHFGPAAAYDSARTFSFGAAACYNVWGNVDAGAYGGKAFGEGGWRGGAAVGVGLR